MIKKVCVVGGGNWGKNHVKTLHELNSLGGIVDKDRSLLKNYKKKYPYLDTFDDLHHLGLCGTQTTTGKRKVSEKNENYCRKDWEKKSRLWSI